VFTLIVIYYLGKDAVGQLTGTGFLTIEECNTAGELLSLDLDMQRDIGFLPGTYHLTYECKNDTEL
jgi:hypothetical protein